ncbi:hypothetical protein GQX73_g3890 [Xylaria multiplex]|uniref:Uncharacterized protein n=1 Tax=Xylaria multiplex TaxID=323545 RepID=A0A7C8MVI9_9PEZI|nr:hypothetical protein GQX73_g3890 [Xylaria multiplex]
MEEERATPPLPATLEAISRPGSASTTTSAAMAQFPGVATMAAAESPELNDADSTTDAVYHLYTDYDTNSDHGFNHDYNDNGGPARLSTDASTNANASANASTDADADCVTYTSQYE